MTFGNWFNLELKNVINVRAMFLYVAEVILASFVVSHDVQSKYRNRYASKSIKILQ